MEHSLGLENILRNNPVSLLPSAECLSYTIPTLKELQLHWEEGDIHKRSKTKQKHKRQADKTGYSGSRL